MTGTLRKLARSAFTRWLLVYLSPFLLLAALGAWWNVERLIRANRYRELGMQLLVAKAYHDQMLRDLTFTAASGVALFAAGWWLWRGRVWRFLPQTVILQLCLVVSRILYPAHWFATFHLGWLSLPGFVWQRTAIAAFAALAALGLAAVWLFGRLGGAKAASPAPSRPVAAACLAAAVLGAISLFLLASPGAPESVRSKAALHVIWIVLDSVRADFVSAYGYHAATTPHIDRLAAGGVVFENAYSQANWTYPSFASMLSSRRLVELPGGRLTADTITAAELFQNAGYATAAYVQNPNLDVEFLFHYGFTSYNQFLVRHGPEPLIALVCRHVRQLASAKRPSFLLVHIQGAHYPYRHRNPYLRQFLGGYSSEEIERANKLLIDNAVVEKGNSAVDWQRLRRRTEAMYAAALRETDEAVGRLLSELRKLNMLERSVVVVSSDHGEEFGLRGRFGHAGLHLYPDLTRVPLILHLPARYGVAGRRVRVPVMNLDILPTLLAVTGVPSLTPLSGANLLEIVQRPLERLAWSSAGDVVAVRDGRYALHADYRRRPARYEWYDLAADPGELRPLAAPPSPEATRLRAHVDRWRHMQRTAAAPAPGGRLEKVSPELLRRLRSLGYVQ